MSTLAFDMVQFHMDCRYTLWGFVCSVKKHLYHQFTSEQNSATYSVTLSCYIGITFGLEMLTKWNSIFYILLLVMVLLPHCIQWDIILFFVYGIKLFFMNILPWFSKETFIILWQSCSHSGFCLSHPTYFILYVRI